MLIRLHQYADLDLQCTHVDISCICEEKGLRIVAYLIMVLSSKSQFICHLISCLFTKAFHYINWYLNWLKKNISHTLQLCFLKIILHSLKQL